MDCEILIGHVLDELKALPDGVVQMAVTSPPYWGLRKYAGAQDQVWDAWPLAPGGSDCEHEWGDTVAPPHGDGGRRAAGFNERYFGTPSKQDKQAETVGAKALTGSAFCQHCGAWRGALGLEPTPELYVQHLVEVFREVRRVLRDDGVLWLNLGDSYAASTKGSGGLGKGTLGISGNKKYGQDSNKGSFYSPARFDIAAAGLKHKDLIGIPWLVAFALRDDGWYLRSDNIWNKPNPMPESVRDRTTRSHEYVFLLTKSARYQYDADAIAEPLEPSSIGRYRHVVEHNEQFKPDQHKHQPGVQTPMEILTRAAANVLARGTKNARSVWTIPPKPYKGAHFATFPPALVERCVRAGSQPGDLVLDPFAGSGTTGAVALLLKRYPVLIDISADYAALMLERMDDALQRPKRYLAAGRTE